MEAEGYHSESLTLYAYKGPFPSEIHVRLMTEEEAKDPLVVAEGLEAPDAPNRRLTAEKLGEMKDPRSVPALIKALKDDNRYVRAQAAKSLGRIGDGRAKGALEALLKDEAESTRRAAQQALEKITSKGEKK